MNTNTLIAAAVSALIVVVVVAGLVISGSPSEQRLLSQDQVRTNNLVRLSSAIRDYHRDADHLPANLDILLNTQTLRELPRDPESEEAYDYQVISDIAYRLCADFALPSRSAGSTDRFWEHGAGRQCYTIEIPANPQ